MLELSIFTPLDLKVKNDHTVIFLSPDEIDQIVAFAQKHTCPRPGCKNLVEEPGEICLSCTEYADWRVEKMYGRPA